MRTDPEFVERRRAYGRASYRRHKAAYVARAAERDKKYKLRGSRGLRYDKRELRLLWIVQDGKCFWCSGALALNGLHVDHLIPLSKGGAHEIANFVLSCPTCNLRKHDMLPLDFAQRLQVA
jgi:5-methylcytosine-specific restriction endonuclease McrA